jgi:hypothetical protein
MEEEQEIDGGKSQRYRYGLLLIITLTVNA